MLNKLSYFIKQKGIGLKIVIPLSFFLSILLSFQIIKPFQENLSQPQMQSLLEFITTPQINKDVIREKLNINTVNEKNYVLSVMSEVLFTLHDNDVIKNFSIEQLNVLLEKAFYLQGVFLSFLISLISIFLFLFTYTILKIIGPSFYNELPKNAWGRILSLVWSVIFVVYVIALQFHLNFGIFYLCLIAILASLVIATKLKKEYLN